MLSRDDAQVVSHVNEEIAFTYSCSSITELLYYLTR